MIPISAAGVPPRKTIARTIARKLPEIFRCDSVSIDITSLKAEKPSRIPNSAMFQSAFGAAPDRMRRRQRRGHAATSAVLSGVGRSFSMDRA